MSVAIYWVVEMFNKQQYLIDKLWRDDIFLVTPNGAKICRVCNEKKYTVEFIDFALYVDGKLPVCSKCLRSKLLGDFSRSVIDRSDFRVKCVRCERKTELGQMGMSFVDNKVTKLCRDCTKSDFNRAFKRK